MMRYSIVELEMDLIRARLSGDQDYSKSIELNYTDEETIVKIKELIHQYSGQVEHCDDHLKLSVSLDRIKSVDEEEILLSRLKGLESLDDNNESEIDSSTPDYISVESDQSPFPSYKKNKQKRQPSDKINSKFTNRNVHDFEVKSNKLVDFFQGYVDKRIETYYQKFDTEMHQMRNELNDIKTFKNDLFERIAKKIDVEFKKQLTTLLKFERQLYKKQLDHLRSQLVHQIGDLEKRVDSLYTRSELDHRLYALKELINNFMMNHSNQFDTEQINIDDYLQFFEPLNLTEDEISALVDDIIDQNHIGDAISSDLNEHKISITTNTTEGNEQQELTENHSSVNVSQTSDKSTSNLKQKSVHIEPKAAVEQSAESQSVTESYAPAKIGNNALIDSKMRDESETLLATSNDTEFIENKNANRFNSLYKRQPIKQNTTETLNNTIDEQNNNSRPDASDDVNAKEKENQMPNHSDMIKRDTIVRDSKESEHSDLETRTKKIETFPYKVDEKQSQENTYNNQLVSLKQADPTTIRRPKQNNPNNVKFVRLSKQGYFDNLPFKK